MSGAERTPVADEKAVTNDGVDEAGAEGLVHVVVSSMLVIDELSDTTAKQTAEDKRETLVQTMRDAYGHLGPWVPIVAGEIADALTRFDHGDVRLHAVSSGCLCLKRVVERRTQSDEYLSTVVAAAKGSAAAQRSQSPVDPPMPSPSPSPSTPPPPPGAVEMARGTVPVAAVASDAGDATPAGAGFVDACVHRMLEIEEENDRLPPADRRTGAQKRGKLQEWAEETYPTARDWVSIVAGEIADAITRIDHGDVRLHAVSSACLFISRVTARTPSKRYAKEHAVMAPKVETSYRLRAYSSEHVVPTSGGNTRDRPRPASARTHMERR